jgi:hypothetical protein
MQPIDTRRGKLRIEQTQVKEQRLDLEEKVHGDGGDHIVCHSLEHLYEKGEQI